MHLKCSVVIHGSFLLFEDPIYSGTEGVWQICHIYDRELFKVISTFLCQIEENSVTTTTFCLFANGNDRLTST